MVVITKASQPNFKIPWKQDVWDQVHLKKEDAVIAYIGKRRKGKSWAALAFCESMDPEGFTPENLSERCFIHPLKFIEWARRPKKEIYSGLALMFDEAGVGVPSRDWQSFNNRALFKVMQVFGHKNFISVFTLPNLGYLDSGPRSLIDYVVHVLSIDKSNDMNVCKVKEIYVDAITGSYKTPYLRYRVDGKWYKFSKPYLFKRPSRKLARAYEDLQESYKQEYEEVMYREAKEMQALDKARREKKTIDEDALIKHVIENKEQFSNLRGGRWSVDLALVEYEFKIGVRVASRIKKVAEQTLNKEAI